MRTVIPLMILGLGVGACQAPPAPPSEEPVKERRWLDFESGRWTPPAPEPPPEGQRYHGAR